MVDGGGTKGPSGKTCSVSLSKSVAVTGVFRGSLASLDSFYSVLPRLQ